MDSFSEYVLERLKVIGPVIGRSMFGGVGFYHRGIMFALIAEGSLYMKVDEQNKKNYEAADMSPFTYQGKGRAVQMSYWEMPSEVLESDQEIKEWVESSYQAAVRSKTKKVTKKKVVATPQKKTKSRT